VRRFGREVLGEGSADGRVEVGDVGREALRLGRGCKSGDGGSRRCGRRRVLLVRGMRLLARYGILGAGRSVGLCSRDGASGRLWELADYLDMWSDRGNHGGEGSSYLIQAMQDILERLGPFRSAIAGIRGSGSMAQRAGHSRVQRALGGGLLQDSFCCMGSARGIDS
jgi:hypothetical protein